MAAVTATVLTTIAVVCAAAGGYAAYAQGEAQEDMAKYNEDVANNAAQQEQWNAEAAAEKAESDAIAAEADSDARRSMERKRHSKLKAKNRAAEGISGFTGEGTPLLMQIENAELMENDILEMNRQAEIEQNNIRYAGQQNALQHTINANGFRSEATRFGKEAKGHGSSKYISGFQGAVSGAEKYGGNVDWEGVGTSAKDYGTTLLNKSKSLFTSTKK